MRRWLLVSGVLLFMGALGLAEGASEEWKTFRVGDLCLRSPSDWYDMTPLVRLLVLPELFSEEGIEGVAVPVAIMRVPSSVEEEPAFLMVLLVEAGEFSQILASVGSESPRIAHMEGLVAGEPGVYEQYEIEEPAGFAWFAYTLQPRADGRHVVLLALRPWETAVPEAVIQEMLFSVGPCPPAPAEPCTFCEEKLALLEQRLEELQVSYEVELKALREKVVELEKTMEALQEVRELRIGVVDAEALFTRVFLPQVAAERSALQAKAQAIQDLQSQYAQGQIKQDLYQLQYAKLQAEYLQAQVQVNMSMLEKMMASPGFTALRGDLQKLRDQTKPLVDQVEALVKEAQVAILNVATFFNQLQELQGAFQQVDKLLTQFAAMKILEVSQQVAQEKGYDLVLRTKDVVMFCRKPMVTDLSSEVETRLWLVFPGK